MSSTKSAAGRASRSKSLWNGISLPEWDADKFYALYQLHHAGRATAADRDLYSRYLMVIIAANMGRDRWAKSLRKRRMDAESSASNVLWHVFEKTRNYALRKPMVETFLTSVNRMISNRLRDLVRLNSRHSLEVAASQLEDAAGGEGHLERKTAPEQVAVDTLRLELEASWERLCAGLDPEVARKTFNLMIQLLFRDGSLPTFDQLPAVTRKRISTDDHATLTFRILGFVRQYARDYDDAPRPAAAAAAAA